MRARSSDRPDYSGAFGNIRDYSGVSRIPDASGIGLSDLGGANVVTMFRSSVRGNANTCIDSESEK